MCTIFTFCGQQHRLTGNPGWAFPNASYLLQQRSSILPSNVILHTDFHVNKMTMCLSSHCRLFRNKQKILDLEGRSIPLLCIEA